MSKKAIILSMSCNQERYINEENAIRQTWGKEVLEGKYDNIELLFYRGGSDSTYLEKDVLHLTSDDTLFGTYQKTMDCFKWLVENKEFDYIIRTNTSTYINVDAIQQFLSLKNVQKDTIFCPHLTINSWSKYTPYGGGHYLIIPKNIITDIFLMYKHLNLNGIDDAIMGLLMGAYYGYKYFEEHILQIDSVSDIKQYCPNELNKAWCIRIKDESNSENNITNMINFHTLYKNIKTQIKPPHGFTKIYTLYGQIPIDA